MGDGLLGCCDLTDHLQLRFLGLIKDSVFIIEVGNISVLVCIFEHFIVILQLRLWFFCDLFVVGIDWGNLLVRGSNLRSDSILFVDFGNYDASGVELTDVLVHWFHAFGAIDHVRHVDSIDFFEGRDQIGGTLLLEFLLRFEYFLGALGCIFLAFSDVFCHRVLELHWFEHVSEDVHDGIVFRWVEMGRSIVRNITVEAIVVAVDSVLHGRLLSSSLVGRLFALHISDGREEVVLRWCRGIGRRERIIGFVGCFVWIVGE